MRKRNRSMNWHNNVELPMSNSHSLALRCVAFCSYYQCIMCWNKALTFGVVSIIFVPLCSPNTCKGVLVQMLLHFSQIALNVCTLVVFINPRCACAARVTVVVPVCVSVSVLSFLPPHASRPRNIGTYGFTATWKKLL